MTWEQSLGGGYMTRILNATRRKMALWLTGKSLASLLCIAAAALLVIAPALTPAHAGVVGIQGTMSNFDVFNETGANVYGAELDLEGCSPDQVTKTYPSHFTTMTKLPYTDGTKSGTRLTFSEYNFTPPNPFITPTVGISTNGHYAVNLPGCEHFGFSVSAQPTATRFYWLGQNSQPVSTAPLSIPSATWSFVPAAGGNPAIVQAVVVPPPPPPLVQFPDAVWVKTFVTELSGPAELEKLISYDPNKLDPRFPSVSPQLPSEVEAEWELLPGDAPLLEPDISPADKTQAIVRRYEFFRYTGTYDELHLPNSLFTGGTPDPAELGGFIAANMVAVNLEVPEPSTAAFLVAALALLARTPRRRRAV
jgi:hypothetical protein